MTKAIIFDFDGVLADTFDISFKICKDIDIKFTLEDFLDHHNGNVYEKPKLIFSGEQVKKYFEAYEKTANADNLFPLGEQIVSLSERYRLFIISSNIETAIGKYLKLGGWLKYFEEIYGAETHESKIKKFEILFRDKNLKPNECIFVTDTLGDLLEGAESGVKTLAVTWGFHEEIRLNQGEPSKIIHEFNELSGAITDFEK